MEEVALADTVEPGTTEEAAPRGWCYAVGDQVIPRRSDRSLPVAKEEEVDGPCFWEGVLDLDPDSECGTGYTLAKWWANGRRWKMPEGWMGSKEQRAKSAPKDVRLRDEVLWQLAGTFGDQLKTEETEEATLGQYVDLLNCRGN